jgi:hypothetical protein
VPVLLQVASVDASGRRRDTRGMEGLHAEAVTWLDALAQTYQLSPSVRLRASRRRAP